MVQLIARFAGWIAPVLKPAVASDADEVIESSAVCCGARVRLWHEADMPTWLGFVRFEG